MDMNVTASAATGGEGPMPNYSRVRAGQLAALMHRALERGDTAALAALRAELAQRPAADQEVCRREWTRQAPPARRGGPVHPPARHERGGAGRRPRRARIGRGAPACVI